MKNRYMFSYGSDRVVDQAPKSAEQMAERIDTFATKYGAQREKYQVYELVPVKIVTKTVTSFERTDD
jgi:hypothetical protein